MSQVPYRLKSGKHLEFFHVLDFCIRLILTTVTLHSAALKASESTKKGLEKGAESPSNGSKQSRRTNAVGSAADLISLISIESPPPAAPAPVTVNVNNSETPEPEPVASATASYSSFASSSRQAEAAEKISQKKLTTSEFTLGGLPSDDWREWAPTVKERPMPIKYE